MTSSASGHRATPRASDILLTVVAESGSHEVAVGDIIHSLRDRAYGIALLVFALPNCVPIPPGVASVVGLPLIIFGIQLAMGVREPWLPKVIARRPIRRSLLTSVLGRAARALLMLEHVSRPRVLWITGPRAERLIGGAVVVYAGSIAIPLPLTNFVPAFGIALIGLGLINRDGIVVALGLLIGLIGVGVTLSVLVSLGALTAWLFA